MLAYITRRLLLIIPTLLGILVVNFFIIQVAPGGAAPAVLPAPVPAPVDKTPQKNEK